MSKSLINTTKLNYFDTGIFDVNWKAKWIWKSQNIMINDFAYLRKKINISKAVVVGRLYISAHNHYKLFVNGKRIGGLLSPAPTNPVKSKYYLTYDITGILEQGINTIGLVIHYLGGDGQNYVNGLPGGIMQCEVIYSDNTTDTFITDNTWKILDQTPYKNGNRYQQNRRISAIEEFDARIASEGWLNKEYDDSHWQNAVYSLIEKENWVLKSQLIPEGYIGEEITPVALAIQEPGLQVFDSGKIVTGWPRVELSGIRDITIRMRYSEDLDESGRVRHNVSNETSENYYDQYTMKGNEKEEWEPDFSYKAFRYIEITGYPKLIKHNELKVLAVHTEIPVEGHFDSSNQLINEIYNACIQTQKNNVVGQLVDCPHREQAQYLADSDLQAETLAYCFDAHNVLEKVLSDFSDEQLEDGRFPFVYPSNYKHLDFDIRIPEWDLHYCTLLWKIYFIYQDKLVLIKYYKPAKKMLYYYLGLRNGDTGLVPVAEGWHISDWPYPNIDHSGEYLTVQNCKIYHALNIMSRIASILGFEDDVKVFDNYSMALKETIIKHLYDVENKAFRDCFNSNQSHQGTNVIAYQYGLVPQEDRQAVLQYIASKGMDCKTLLSLNLFQVLFENREEKKAFELLNRTDYPGWGHMIHKGFKTIWEGFDDIESHCHAWNAYPARLFLEYIVGIKCSSPGFGDIEIKPFIPEGMTFAEGRVPTVRGHVYARWDRIDGGISLKIDIPVNTEAKVYIPKVCCDNAVIKESGELIWKDRKFYDRFTEIKYCEENDNTIVLKVQSRSYLFILGNN